MKLYRLAEEPVHDSVDARRVGIDPTQERLVADRLAVDFRHRDRVLDVANGVLPEFRRVFYSQLPLHHLGVVVPLRHDGLVLRPIGAQEQGRRKEEAQKKVFPREGFTPVHEQGPKQGLGPIGQRDSGGQVIQQGRLVPCHGLALAYVPAEDVEGEDEDGEGEDEMVGRHCRCHD